MAIICLSSLPYLHELITTRNFGLKEWVPNFGIESLLTDDKGKVLGFSSYRVFLYTILIFIFTELGWLFWLLVSKHKKYYYALFIPVTMGAYQIVIILLNLRKSGANSPEFKLTILLAITIISVLAYLKKNRLNFRICAIWFSIIIISTLPYFHDIITTKSGALRTWVPNVGLESLLTNAQGKIGGFNFYRTFLYFLMLHIYSHFGWLGAFIYYEARLKKVRPFLLIPVITSLYSVVIILLNWQESGFNKPDVKFYITIVLGILLAVNFFFNDKIKFQNNLIEKPQRK